jgi:hypothetical protein
VKLDLFLDLLAAFAREEPLIMVVFSPLGGELPASVLYSLAGELQLAPGNAPPEFDLNQIRVFKPRPIYRRSVPRGFDSFQF